MNKHPPKHSHTHSESTHSRRQFIQYRKSTSAPCQVKVTGVDTSNRCLILFTRNDKKRQEIVFIRFLLWAIDIQHSTTNTLNQRNEKRQKNHQKHRLANTKLSIHSEL